MVLYLYRAILLSLESSLYFLKEAPRYNESVKLPLKIWLNNSKLTSGFVDQWFVTMVETPQSENRITCYKGYSLGIKCFEVSTFLSISVL